MKKTLLILGFLLSSTFVFSQKVDYSTNVAKIIYSHCTTCHRKGEIAPFPLTNYTEVKNWSTMIKYVTGIRYMPPWKSDTKYNHFQGENVLTDAEIKTISDWVTQGTPQGDPKVEPALPIFPKGSQVGVPDKVISFKQKYIHKGNNKDEYRYFVIPTGLTQAKDLVSFEIRPGNPKIVHHTLAWEDTTGVSAKEDAKTPEYGYDSGTGTALNGLDAQLPGYVPGQRPIIYNNGISQRLSAKSDIKIQMHYAPTTTDEWDSTSINLFFAQKPSKRYVKSKVLVPTPGVLINDVFYIPANTVKEFHGTFTMPETATMLNISPHMHKLGQRWEVFAITPNKDTVKLVRINEWDFNWQGTYSLKKPIILPKNSVIHAFAKYDNTSKNINNPNNPPKAIGWGEKTSDEMYYLPFSWVSYQAGDENLNLESNLFTATDDSEFYSVKNNLYPIAPNPAREQVKIGFTLQESGNVNLYFSDLNGRKVKTILNNQFHLEGLHQEDVNLSALQSGLYIVTMEINGKPYSQKLVVE